jgi:predicted regulator of Ras-like GTPase activity (Roadblock/LC7/MglB family)
MRGAGIRELDELVRVTGVRSAVRTDPQGALLDAVGEADAEAVAAVAGFLCVAFAEAGAPLGLGALRRVALQGAARAALLLVDDGGVVAASVEPAGALAGVEKALEGSGGKER